MLIQTNPRGVDDLLQLRRLDVVGAQDVGVQMDTPTNTRPLRRGQRKQAPLLRT